MPSLNKVIVIGNLVNEPVERQFENSNKAEIRLAIDNSKGKDDTTFITVECWNNLANHVVKYLAKGSCVCVEGSLMMNTWEKEGKKRTAYYILARNIQFLSYKSDSVSG